MTLLKTPAAAHALDHPGAYRLYLLYGPDGAGSAALARRLETAMGPEAERVDLTGADVKGDPARLADEAAALGLFGGHRHIRLTGGDECADAVDALLSAAAVEAPVVLVAGALKATGALLKRYRDHAQVMACISYAPEGAEAERLAVTLARERGLRLAASVARRLVGDSLGDRAILASELDKIALYLDAAPDRPRDADAEALAAIGAGLDELDLGKLVDAVLDGRPAEAAIEIDLIGSEMIPALRALARRLALLADLRATMDQGQSAASAVAARGKMIFFKDRAAITRQVSRWPLAKLQTASARLFAAERTMMKPRTAGEIVARDELIAIARAAERL